MPACWTMICCKYTHKQICSTKGLDDLGLFCNIPQGVLCDAGHRYDGDLKFCEDRCQRSA